jgi:hypothetical protein
MHTDPLLYRLYQERPATLFELAGLPTPDVAYALASVEVKQTAFRLDGVLAPVVSPGRTCRSSSARINFNVARTSTAAGLPRSFCSYTGTASGNPGLPSWSIPNRRPTLA